MTGGYSGDATAWRSEWCILWSWWLGSQQGRVTVSTAATSISPNRSAWPVDSRHGIRWRHNNVKQFLKEKLKTTICSRATTTTTNCFNSFYFYFCVKTLNLEKWDSDYGGMLIDFLNKEFVEMVKMTKFEIQFWRHWYWHRGHQSQPWCHSSRRWRLRSDFIEACNVHGDAIVERSVHVANLSSQCKMQT